MLFSRHFSVQVVLFFSRNTIFISEDTNNCYPFCYVLRAIGVSCSHPLLGTLPYPRHGSLSLNLFP